MSSLYILDVNPLPDTQFANIFSHSIGCLFILLMVSFAVQKLFSLMSPHLLFYCLCFRCHIKKSLARRMSRSFLPTFSSRSFVVSGLMFKSLIHFELIFVSGVRLGSRFILLHVTIQFFQHHLWRDWIFSLEYSWLPCQILFDHMCLGLFLGSWFCSIGLYVCFYASTILFDDYIFLV